MSKTPIGGPLRRDLEAALTTDEFRKAFEELKTKDEVFGKYTTVEALVALCQPGAPDPKGRDRVLRAILRTSKGGNTLLPLLFLMFWNSLAAIYWQLCRRVSDPESLFAQIQWELLQAATAWDPDRRRHKIDVNIVLNTKRGAVKWMRRGAEERAELRKIGDLKLAGRHWAPLEEIHIPPEELEAFLLDLLQRGVLTPIQVEVVLETDIHRRMDVYGWAAAKGIRRSTAYFHRQEAFKAIRKHLMRRVEPG